MRPGSPTSLIGVWRTAVDVENINWLYDHSGYLLACKAYRVITGRIVIASFRIYCGEYGTPFSTLTDNGKVYTARFAKGKNGFGYLLSDLSVVQENGSSAHLQTQGQIERFHQTLKRYLGEQYPAKSTAELQQQLDEFRKIYNQHRPHRSLSMRIPADADGATTKADPMQAVASKHYRIRYDQVDEIGKFSLRRAANMHSSVSGFIKEKSRSLSSSITTRLRWWRGRPGKFSPSMRLIPAEVTGQIFSSMKKRRDQEK